MIFSIGPKETMKQPESISVDLVYLVLTVHTNSFNSIYKHSDGFKIMLSNVIKKVF